MSTTPAPPATTPIPVQLSESECTTFLLPHLSMPKRGPKCTLGYYRVCNLIVWRLSTGLPWQCLPVPTDSDGTPALPDPTVYKVCATWAAAGSLWQAFLASVAPRAAEKQRALRVRHGAGTNTVATKGGLAWGMRGTNTSRARKASRSSTLMGLAERLSPWRPSMKRIWCCCRRACKR